jgi:hypothetical protein
VEPAIPMANIYKRNCAKRQDVSCKNKSRSPRAKNLPSLDHERATMDRIKWRRQETRVVCKSINERLRMSVSDEHEPKGLDFDSK